jgi:hypothetical protein
VQRGIFGKFRLQCKLYGSACGYLDGFVCNPSSFLSLAASLSGAKREAQRGQPPNEMQWARAPEIRVWVFNNLRGSRIYAHDYFTAANNLGPIATRFPVWVRHNGILQSHYPPFGHKSIGCNLR